MRSSGWKKLVFELTSQWAVPIRLPVRCEDRKYQPMTKNMIVYLIGFPGSGKLTVARELARLLPSIVVDNHFVNNVIFSLIDPDGRSKLPQSVWVNVRKVREAVFDTIQHLSKPDRNFILTNALIDGLEADRRCFEEVQALARARGAKFHVFRLLVSTDELCRRIASSGRAELFKEIDVDAAKERAETEDVFVPKECPYTDLDTTSMSASECASEIMSKIRVGDICDHGST